MAESPSEASAPAAPFLRVVSGNPTPEELAALLAVIASRGGGSTDDAPDTSAWADRQRALRAPLQHGPGAWRASVFPR